jgi:hypothetical protein
MENHGDEEEVQLRKSLQLLTLSYIEELTSLERYLSKSSVFVTVFWEKARGKLSGV